MFNFFTYHLKILLEHFNTNGVNRIFFQPRAGNESLLDDSKDNCVRIVNFATSIVGVRYVTISYARGV